MDDYVCITTDVLEPTPDWHANVGTPVSEFKKYGFTIIDPKDKE